MRHRCVSMELFAVPIMIPAVDEARNILNRKQIHFFSRSRVRVDPLFDTFGLSKGTTTNQRRERRDPPPKGRSSEPFPNGSSRFAFLCPNGTLSQE
jgi:hypothetical protein